MSRSLRLYVTGFCSYKRLTDCTTLGNEVVLDVHRSDCPKLERQLLDMGMTCVYPKSASACNHDLISGS